MAKRRHTVLGLMLNPAKYDAVGRRYRIDAGRQVCGWLPEAAVSTADDAITRLPWAD